MNHSSHSVSSLLLAAALFAAPAAAQVVAYHDQDANAHQAQANVLAPAGFRMIALSIYGTTASQQ